MLVVTNAGSPKTGPTAPQLCERISTHLNTVRSAVAAAIAQAHLSASTQPDLPMAGNPLRAEPPVQEQPAQPALSAASAVRHNSPAQLRTEHALAGAEHDSLVLETRALLLLRG